MFICENNFYIRYFFFFHVALKLGLLIRAHKYTHKQREKQIQQHIKIRWLLQYLSVFMSFPSKQIRAQTTEIPTFSLSLSLTLCVVHSISCLFTLTLAFSGVSLQCSSRWRIYTFIINIDLNKTHSRHLHLWDTRTH